ncbi:MAG: 6-phosphogluconolactonase [Rhizobiaceae bacterium]
MPAAINYVRHDFASRDELAAGLAATVAGALSEAIEDSGTATLAVSGGSTPRKFFEALARIDIDWSNVTVLPVDERFVPETSDRSNARLIKEKLLQGPAAAARFVPLFAPNMDVGDAAREADDHVGRLGVPLDVVILGMGNDGHTASFFPDARELDALLDAKAAALVLPVHATSAGEDRLTLTLPPIVTARFIALHIEGAEKAAALDKALARGSMLPIRRVIDAAETPVEIFWAA